jgi:ankyrin repeat protein
MSQALPARPNLEFLKKTAKDRLRRLRAEGKHTSLADVQRVLAREYGFPSWRRLKTFVVTKADEAIPGAPPPPATREPALERRAKISEWKPLMDAAYAGDPVRVAALLDRGADPNVLSTTTFRHRPLHRVIEHKKTAPKHAGHDAVIGVLLARGADPRRRATPMQYTALQLAAIDEPRFVPQLRESFEPLDIYHAAVVGDLPRVRRLLSADRSLANAVDENGMTALHYCAASSMFTTSEAAGTALAEVAKALLASGADPNVPFRYPDGSPLPPLFFSTGLHDHAAMAMVLIEGGADPCDMESVFHAADEGHQQSLDVLERLVPRDRLAAECTRCLAVLVRWGRTRGVPWLLAHGADPNWIDPEGGESALQTASKDAGKARLVKLLLAHGGDPPVKSRQGTRKTAHRDK